MKLPAAFALLLAAANPLTQAVSHLLATAGVAALDLDTGRAMSVREAERFPMGSVYKLPIAITVLHAIDTGALSFDQQVTIQPSDFAPGYSPIRDKANGKPVTMTVEAIVATMVSDSDNTAADVLQPLVGGGAKITAAIRSLGVEDVRVDRTETQIAADIRAHGVAAYNADARDTATPNGMLVLLRQIQHREDGLTPASHDLLLKWMTESSNPQRIRNGLPPGAILAHKTGTMPGVMNDVGIITSPDGHHHIALVVFTKNARSKQDDAAIAKAIAGVASVVYERFTR
jgi:beta-lactamase class A